MIILEKKYSNSKLFLVAILHQQFKKKEKKKKEWMEYW